MEPRCFSTEICIPVLNKKDSYRLKTCFAYSQNKSSGKICFIPRLVGILLTTSKRHIKMHIYCIYSGLTHKVMHKNAVAEIQLLKRVSRTIPVAFPFAYLPHSCLGFHHMITKRRTWPASVMCICPTLVNCQCLHQLTVAKSVGVIYKEK